MKRRGAKDVTTQAWLGILFMASCSGLDKSIREAKGDDSFINWSSSVQANDTAWLGDQRLGWSQQGPGGLGPIFQDCAISMDHQYGRLCPDWGFLQSSAILSASGSQCLGSPGELWLPWSFGSPLELGRRVLSVSGFTLSPQSLQKARQSGKWDFHVPDSMGR